MCSIIYYFYDKKHSQASVGTQLPKASSIPAQMFEQFPTRLYKRNFIVLYGYKGFSYSFSNKLLEKRKYNETDK